MEELQAYFMVCVYTRIRSVIQAPGHPTIFHKSRRTVQAAEHAHGGQLSWVGPVPEVLRRQFADGRLEVARAGVALWCDGDRMRESDMSDLTTHQSSHVCTITYGTRWSRGQGARRRSGQTRQSTPGAGHPTPCAPPTVQARGWVDRCVKSVTVTARVTMSGGARQGQTDGGTLNTLRKTIGLSFAAAVRSASGGSSCARGWGLDDDDDDETLSAGFSGL